MFTIYLWNAINIPKMLKTLFTLLKNFDKINKISSNPSVKHLYYMPRLYLICP